MRYRFIDEILSLETAPPRMAVAKTFAPRDDALTGPAGPDRVPPSLVIELMAMTGGQLLFRHLGRERVPLLLKAEDVRFALAVRPGDRLTATAVLRGTAAAATDTMAQMAGEVRGEGGVLVASGRFFYLCVRLPEGAEPGDLAPTIAGEARA